jgi:hypothetical protein
MVALYAISMGVAWLVSSSERAELALSSLALELPAAGLSAVNPKPNRSGGKCRKSVRQGNISGNWGITVD